MRFTILLFAFGLITNEGLSGPSQAASNSEEYIAYEEKDSAADDYSNDKQEKDESEADGSEIQDEDTRSHASYKQSLNNNEYENLMEETTNNKNENINQEQEPSVDQRKSNSGLDETEDEDLLQPVSNTRLNTFKRNQNGNEYRSGNRDMALHDGNVMENDRRTVKDKSEYNNEAFEARDEPLYKQITYYNKVQGDLFHKKKPNNVFNSNRDRREIIGNLQENMEDKKKEVEGNNEDSMTAIKRNIKKLSREELEDLLNSLSDDKKVLLNKIIGNKIANENLNKREITKKAGAVEENNCLDNGHSDLNKLEGGSSIDSISLSQSETTETTKQSKSDDYSKTKIPEAGENKELSEVKLNVNQESIKSVSDAGLAEPSVSVGKESINKRDTNSEDASLDKSEIIEDCDSDKDSNWSELMKDETELHKTYSNMYKRDIGDYSNTADVKSLEDSFPYYEAENSKSSDSQMAPLIRVKRTNRNVKRAYDRSPGNMKVPFFPAAVNDEDDNEKDEFDDGSNFENSYNYEKMGKDRIHHKDLTCYSDYVPNSNKIAVVGVRSKSKFKPETDSAKIGSDTDNILSNVEGVDDTLMYKNEIRRKRFADDANLNKLQTETNDENAPQGSVDGNDITYSLSKDNFVRYQDQDGIGSIQRPSDEEVGRYKRIRRLNQPPIQESVQKN